MELTPRVASAERVFQKYEALNLAPLLAQIRQPGRYGQRDGHNILTNALLSQGYDRGLVLTDIERAALAGTQPGGTFVSSLEGLQQGLSLGLNPYTDWSLAQLEGRPSRWFLLLGLDWYSVAGLLPKGAPPEDWLDLNANPFSSYDPYWFNLWGWILGKYHKEPSGGQNEGWTGRASVEEASAFIRSNNVGLIFHNLIPYLRPADIASTSRKWPSIEWAKPDVRRDVLDDLALLRELVGGDLQVYCTKLQVKVALFGIGYPEEDIVSFGAHPSRVFNPSVFRRRDIHFPVRNIGGR